MGVETIIDADLRAQPTTTLHKRLIIRCKPRKLLGKLSIIRAETTDLIPRTALSTDTTTAAHNDQLNAHGKVACIPSEWRPISKI